MNDEFKFCKINTKIWIYLFCVINIIDWCSIMFVCMCRCCCTARNKVGVFLSVTCLHQCPWQGPTPYTATTRCRHATTRSTSTQRGLCSSYERRLPRSPVTRSWPGACSWRTLPTMTSKSTSTLVGLTLFTLLKAPHYIVIMLYLLNYSEVWLNICSKRFESDFYYLPKCLKLHNFLAGKKFCIFQV